MASPRPLQAYERVILTLFAIFMAVLVLAVSYASYLSVTTAGPRGIAQDAAGDVWVEFDGSFHVFSRDGRALARHSIEAFGIAPPVAAMTALPDGAMLIGSNTTGTLHVVRRDGTAGEVIDPAAAGRGRLFGGFHLLVDPDTRHIFIADTSNHRILVLDRRGKLLHRVGSDNGQPGLLHFPNGLARTANGNLLVIDNRAATSFADVVREDQLAARTRRPASGVRDVAGATPDERRRPDRVWKAAALSALYPGLGQLFNGDFGDAIKCLVNFSYIAITGLGPFLAWQGKIAEVPTEQLVFLGLLALAVWLLSVANAAWIAQKAANRRWGVLPSDRGRTG